MTKHSNPRKSCFRRQRATTGTTLMETGTIEKTHDHTTSCRESTVKAASNVKVEDFTTVIRRAVPMLMKQHGYSRERATATLREAILNNTTMGPYHPSDLEVFNIMRKHALGVDEATSVLSVSHAVREMTIQGVSSAVALQRLIDVVTLVQVPTTPIASKTTLAQHSLNSVPLVSVRILPVMPQVPTTPSVSQSDAPNATLPSQTRTKDKRSKSASDAKISHSVNSKNTRPRADSLADVVSDKLSASGDSTGLVMKSGTGKPPMAPMITRSGTGASSGSSKRLRSASDEARIVDNTNCSASSPLHGSTSPSGSNNGNSSNSNKRSRRNSPSVVGNSNSAGKNSTGGANV